VTNCIQFENKSSLVYNSICLEYPVNFIFFTCAVISSKEFEISFYRALKGSSELGLHLVV